jgi:hypothetical protein
MQNTQTDDDTLSYAASGIIDHFSAHPDGMEGVFGLADLISKITHIAGESHYVAVLATVMAADAMCGAIGIEPSEMDAVRADLRERGLLGTLSRESMDNMTRFNNEVAYRMELVLSELLDALETEKE